MLKMDGSTRWAVDYHRLNQCTVPDSFPTLRIANVMEGLAGSRVFPTLDDAQAYHNVPIKPGNQDLTAFVCLFGVFEFRRMPFGLRNVGRPFVVPNQWTTRLEDAIISDPGVASLSEVSPEDSISRAWKPRHPPVFRAEDIADPGRLRSSRYSQPPN